MTGQGGWPLTVFLDSEGVPFYGGTYFPPEPRQGMPSFRQVLEATAGAYRTQRESSRGVGEDREGLAAVGRVEQSAEELSGSILAQAVSGLARASIERMAGSAAHRSSRRRAHSSSCWPGRPIRSGSPSTR